MRTFRELGIDLDKDTIVVIYEPTPACPQVGVTVTGKAFGAWSVLEEPLGTNPKPIARIALKHLRWWPKAKPCS